MAAYKLVALFAAVQQLCLCESSFFNTLLNSFHTLNTDVTASFKVIFICFATSLSTFPTSFLLLSFLKEYHHF